MAAHPIILRNGSTPVNAACCMTAATALPSSAQSKLEGVENYDELGHHLPRNISLS